MKKILSVMLAAGMMLGTVALANEYDTMLITEELEDPAVAEAIPTDFVLAEASVVSFDAEANALTVLVDEAEVVLNIGEETVIIDAATKIPSTVENLAEGSKIVVYHSSLMTMSLPPQTPTYAIITGAESGVNTFFMEVASVESDGETFTVTDTDGNYVLTFTHETPISPYRTRNIVVAENIEVGDRLLFSADLMTMSIPTRVNPTEIILVKYADQKLISDLTYVFEEKNVAPTEVDGVVYLPLRAAAEHMGYTVAWEGETQTVTLTRENRSYTLTIGRADYGYNRSLLYFPAPALLDSTTFVPVDFVKTIR